MGGKRVCLGKTFAETAVRFTLPLMYHHFDFKLKDPNFEKPKYSVGGEEEPKIMMFITNRHLN
jgi:cytochrome P450